MSKPYTHYSAEELALDDLFVRWVQHPADEEVALFWEGFERQHPARRHTVDVARQLVLGASCLPGNPLSADETGSLWGRIRHSLGDVDEVRHLRPDARNVVAWWYFARTLAAVAGVLLFIGWAWWSQADDTFLTVQTGPGQTRQLHLPDGSRITLQENSELRYAQRSFTPPWTDDGCARSVWLTGGAEFDVPAPNSAGVAFHVHLPDLTVEAKKTSFSVLPAQGSKPGHVRLHTGQLRLLLNNQRVVGLQPGQLAVVAQNTVRVGR